MELYGTIHDIEEKLDNSNLGLVKTFKSKIHQNKQIALSRMKKLLNEVTEDEKTMAKETNLDIELQGESQYASRKDFTLQPTLRIDEEAMDTERATLPQIENWKS